MARQHVILLAFADARGDLPELREEIRRLQDLFERFQGDGRCTLVFRPNATLDQLFRDLQQYRDRIAIVHYGGHADSGRILLEAAADNGSERFGVRTDPIRFATEPRLRITRESVADPAKMMKRHRFRPLAG
jgi:hypothetical protein